jgi:hypothetical protein
MKRDKELYGRASRLLEISRRHYRQGRVTSLERTMRQQWIIRAHYKAQHEAGASDYPSFPAQPAR